MLWVVDMTEEVLSVRLLHMQAVCLADVWLVIALDVEAVVHSFNLELFVILDRVSGVL